MPCLFVPGPIFVQGTLSASSSAGLYEGSPAVYPSPTGSLGREMVSWRDMSLL
jgi:hypothetical protein